MNTVNPNTQPEIRPSRWRWVRRAATVLFVVLLIGGLFVANAWHSIRNRGLAERARAMGELDATEPGWRMPDLTAARTANQPPPEENVCELAKQVAATRPKSLTDWQSRSVVGDPPDPNRRLNTDDLAKGLLAWTECQKQLALAKRVRACAGGSAAVNWDHPNPIAIVLPHCDHLRHTAALLDLEAVVAAHTRRPDDAVDAAAGILALTRGINDEPLLISQLVRLAVTNIAARSVERTLGLVVVSDSKLAEFQRAIAAEADQPRLLWGLLGERALMFKLGESIDKGSIGGREIMALTDGKVRAPESLVSFAARTITPGAQAVYLEVMNKYVAAARLPVGPRRTDEMKAADQSLDGRDDLEAKAVRHVLPSMLRVGEADTRCAALCRLTATALACERFRLKTGHFPNALADLPKDLLADIPTDPYTDAPLLYKKCDDGAVVYVTGPDQADDGGKLTHRQGPPSGHDFGFRLYLPPHRWQPPLPEPKSE